MKFGTDCYVPHANPRWVLVSWHKPWCEDAECRRNPWPVIEYDGDGWFYAHALGLEVCVRLWGHRWL